VCSALIGAGLVSTSLQIRGGQRANASKRAPETRAVAAAPPTATVAEPRQAAPEFVVLPVIRSVVRPVIRPVTAPPAPVQHPLGRATRSSLARITKLDRAAVKAYQRLNPVTARRRLRAAVAECTRAGLARHPIAARTHALLGVVLAGGFKQPDLAAEEFRTALQIDPAVPVPARYASEADVATAFRGALAGGDLR